MRIVNTTDGEKVLYDIYPIEMAERPGNAGTTSTNNNIPQQTPVVNNNSRSNSLRDSIDDYAADFEISDWLLLN